MPIAPAINFNSLTALEIAIIQAIADGTYFVDEETPTGTVNGVNTTFTLASAPNPTTSLHLQSSGIRLQGGGIDYTLKTAGTIIFKSGSKPFAPEVILADYRVTPS